MEETIVSTAVPETETDAPASECIPEDDILDADIRARIIELQLKLEAEYEASGRLSAEEEEQLRQEREEAVYREQAQEVIDGYRARRNLIASGSVRGWRDSMYDGIAPLRTTFWDKWGDRIIIGIYFIFCLAFIVSTIVYQDMTRFV